MNVLQFVLAGYLSGVALCIVAYFRKVRPAGVKNAKLATVICIFGWPVILFMIAWAFVCFARDART